MPRPASLADPEIEQRASGERAPFRVPSREKGDGVKIAHGLPRVGRPAVSRIPFTPPLIRKAESRATYFPSAPDYRRELKAPQSGPVGETDEPMSYRHGENRPDGGGGWGGDEMRFVVNIRWRYNRDALIRKSPLAFCIGAPGLVSVQEIRRPVTTRAESA